jgi:hypothetical protein
MGCTNPQDPVKTFFQLNANEGSPNKPDTFFGMSGPVGLEERLSNAECHLKLHGPVPKDIYSRLKQIEDRILQLEGLSPEYFQFWVSVKIFLVWFIQNLYLRSGLCYTSQKDGMFIPDVYIPHLIHTVIVLIVVITITNRSNMFFSNRHYFLDTVTNDDNFLQENVPFEEESEVEYRHVRKRVGTVCRNFFQFL